MWVRVECEECSHNYSYSRQIEAKAEGQTSAEDRYALIVKDWLKNKSFSFERCPECGYIQSWMYNAAKSEIGSWIGVLTAIVFGIVLYAILGPTGSSVSNFGRLDWAVTVFAALGVLLIMGVAGLIAYAIGREIYDPNRGHEVATETKNPIITFSPRPAGVPLFDPATDLDRADSGSTQSVLTIFIFSLAIILSTRLIILSGVLTNQLGFSKTSLTYVMAVIIGGVVGMVIFKLTFRKEMSLSKLYLTIFLVLVGLPVVGFTGFALDKLIADWEHFLDMSANVEGVCKDSWAFSTRLTDTPLGVIWVYGPLDDESLEREIAASTDEIDTLICVIREEVRVESCQYTRSSRERIRIDWEIGVFNWSTGELRATRMFEGDNPRGCPGITSDIDDIVGSDPSAEGIKQWLSELETGEQ